MNKYSFKDILEKEIVIDKNKVLVFDKIEIPMIQRDYAQGRKNESEVRARFLEAIFDSLKSEKELDLDFVYGSITESTKTFIPLDGQQRLTTLFLLHWYIGSRELKEHAHKRLMDLLTKFTYSTRVSSRRFCEELVKTKLHFEQAPKEEITNLSWFFKSYKKDPTVNSMLNMLNAIHERYPESGESDLFDKLNKLQFYILPLNGFNLTEELYVKMNARGKQLTDFENFKADITKWMKESSNQRKDYKKSVSLRNREMPYYLSYSQKIDNEWTNFFWKMTKDYDIEERDKKGHLIHPNGKVVDPLFLRVIYRYYLNKYVSYSKIDNRIIDKETDYQILYKEEKYHNFNPFHNILSLENVLFSFEKFFDEVTANWDNVFEAIQPSWPSSNKWTFYDNNFTQSDRVILLGITSFLENNNFDEIKFKQWMRVVWNITENTDISDASSMVGVMRLMNELSQYSSDIYSFLADDNNQISSTSSKIAMTEERTKSKLIITDLNWENAFLKAEEHPFFRGSVGFIMTDEMTINDFLKRTDLALKVFDEKGVNDEYRSNGSIFLRAMISRYADSSLIGQNFTDTDESEHYLKKMLSSNETVRKATREWFSLENETKLKERLNEEVNKESQIPGWSTNDVNEKNRVNRAHEALYSKPDLQRWMQQKKAVRFSWSSSHLWVSRPRSWHDWIMLDSKRNELITELLKKGFSTDNQGAYSEDEQIHKIDYFWDGNIVMIGKIDNYDIRITFDNEKTLTVEVLLSDKWLKISDYEYVNENLNLMDTLNEELFKEARVKKLVGNIIVNPTN